MDKKEVEALKQEIKDELREACMLVLEEHLKKHKALEKKLKAKHRHTIIIEGVGTFDTSIQRKA